MCELLTEEFDVRVLNPSGVEIYLPFWVFKRLKKLHLLERDRETGKRRICARVFGLMEIWEAPEFRPDRALKSLPSGLSAHSSKTQDQSLSQSAWAGLLRNCVRHETDAIKSESQQKQFFICHWSFFFK